VRDRAVTSGVAALSSSSGSGECAPHCSVKSTDDEVVGLGEEVPLTSAVIGTVLWPSQRLNSTTLAIIAIYRGGRRSDGGRGT
jgi:hypothetical protein